MKKIRCCILILLLPLLLPAQKNKLKLVWSDEFEYTGLPDSSKWNYEEGFVRNNEPQYYTRRQKENCRVENGCLVIEARKEDFLGAKYTSASITTQGIAEFQYGRIEMRAKVPKGRGSWAAFWMLGQNHGKVKWPDCGEIDIMEYVGKDSGLVYGTVHYANESKKYQNDGRKPNMGNPAEGFHIYAVDWTKDSLSFFYDEKCYFVFKLNNKDAHIKAIFNKKYYILANLALGRKGTLCGVLDDSILPLTYWIDYVRVYQ